jgi:hypothetical protein
MVAAIAVASARLGMLAGVAMASRLLSSSKGAAPWGPIPTALRWDGASAPRCAACCGSGKECRLCVRWFDAEASGAASPGAARARGRGGRPVGAVGGPGSGCARRAGSGAAAAQARAAAGRRPGSATARDMRAGVAAATARVRLAGDAQLRLSVHWVSGSGLDLERGNGPCEWWSGAARAARPKEEEEGGERR